MTESESRSAIVLELAEEFLERYRKGERPPLKEYIDRHPEFAAEIKEVFPAMAMMENIAVADSSLEGDEPEKKTAKPAEVAQKQLGDYRIIREIGHGGMGVVYEAEQISLGRHVALKVLPNQALADAKHKRRFEREAKAAAKLHHTNIVPVFGVGEHEGLPYYVMQFIQGLGLDVVLDELNRMQPGAAHTPTGLPTGEIRISRREIAAADMARSLMTGAFQRSALADDEADAPEKRTIAATMDQPAASAAPKSGVSSTSSSHGLNESFTVSSSSIILPGSGTGAKSSAKKQSYWQSVASIGRQVADALEYAHKQGILHRDIKPSNLLLDLRGTVWVTDFGLAKVAGPGGDNLTHTGDILGTLRYMPPEAFDGKSDARGDVYSLGVTMYELLALRPAFDEKDRKKLIKNVTTGEPAPLHKVNREVPRDLVTIIHKAIDREPARRYATAEDLASDLQRFLDDEPIQARRQTQLERYWRWARHNPGIAVLGGVLTAVLVIATLASIIVASRMAALAGSEAKAAWDERAARQEAVDATKREAKEREQAELSKQRAVEALQKAEENFAKARSAVNDYLTAVSEDEQLKAPGLQGLRMQLLGSALQFYHEFLKERSSDPTLRKELAGVHYKVGEIYRELGQFTASRQSFGQARTLYEALALADPNDVDVQYGLAMALSRTGVHAKSVSILEKLIKPDDPKYHYDLSLAYTSIALDGSATSAKRPVTSKELEYLRKALDVAERLVKLRPDDADAHVVKSACINNIAIRIWGQHDEEAIELLRRSTQEDEAAYRLSPNHPLAARFLTIGLNNLAMTARRLGFTDEAVAAHRKRAAVLDRRARDNPQVPGFDSAMAQGYTTLLYYLRDAGLLDEAAITAVRARQRIAEASEDNTEFFRHASAFQFEALATARARSKANPDGAAALEREAVETMAALRRHVVAGWRDAKWMGADARTESLRQRADFKDLVSRMIELESANAAAGNRAASAAAKLAARQRILAALEVVAAPLPPARFVRRYLATARQDLAQALLDAGRVEEARREYDVALAVREQLVQESAFNEQLRADLAQSQSAAGDLFAAAGKLADAAKTWDKALATLEDGLKANTKSIPFRTALVERLAHIAYQEGKTGLWDRALAHYRRAFQIQPPTDGGNLYFAGLFETDAGNPAAYQALAKSAAGETDFSKIGGIHAARLLALTDEGAARHPAAVRRIADTFRHNNRGQEAWLRGLAHLRLGETEKAIEYLERPGTISWKWPGLALAYHRAGKAGAARDALARAIAEANSGFRAGLAADPMRHAFEFWDEWLHYRIQLMESHLAIYGKPPPESPYERLHRGRVFSALEEHDKAEAEFAAAVAMRPDDADVWLARSRIFAKLGQNERMAADLLRAQQLKGDDPNTWVETGRMLAERGEHQQADVAFARASVLGKGELNRFLDAGWWVVGPYPERLDLPCPPERNPDPSKPVAAVGENRELKWQAVGTTPHTNQIQFPKQQGGPAKASSSYALTFVHADTDRTATLHLWPKHDGRVWVNGRLVFAGFGEGKKSTTMQIPVTLRKGRNTVLVKNRHDKDVSCECAFLDAPIRRGYELRQFALWNEIADAFAEADRRAPLHDYPSRIYVQALLAAGRDAEAGQVFAEMVRRHGKAEVRLAEADYLPPSSTPERQSRVEATRKFAEGKPEELHRFHRLAHASFRAGQFEEAEKNLRKAMGKDKLYYQPLLASTLHFLGKAEEAKKTLEKAEENHAALLKKALAAPTFRLAQGWEDELWYQVTLREARLLIRGKHSDPTTDEIAFLAKARTRLAELDKVEDDYARLTMTQSDPRLWIDYGRRLGDLQNWDQAAKAFAKAAALKPKETLKDIQFWNARGRAYAELGKWDEAAADFVKALELAPTQKLNWFAGSASVHDQIVRLEEVFPRIAKLRPTDAQLWIQRVHYLARTAQWTEAAKASAKVLQLDQADHLTWHFAAFLHLQAGELQEYHRICKDMWDRFANTKDEVIAQRVGTALLLAPQEPPRMAAVLQLMKNAQKTPNYNDWYGFTIALGHLRLGELDQAAEALRRTTHPQRPAAPALQAMIDYKRGQTDAARQSLIHAVEQFAREVKPGPEEVRTDWIIWLAVHQIVKEAESMIPAAPAQLAQAVLSAEEQAVRRERKDRAEQLATLAALAQIRLDVGQKNEAAAELRVVLAERKKIAAEEPANLDYQADAAVTRLRLSQFLLDGDQVEDAVKEFEAALASLEKSAAEHPKYVRFRTEAALGVQAMGDLYAKANRPSDALQAWRRGIDLLNAALNQNPGNRTIEAALAAAEFKLGYQYASLTLWSEAAELLSSAVQRAGGSDNIGHWARAADALLGAGKHAQLKQLCAAALARFADKSSDPNVTLHLALIGAFADDLTDDPDQLVQWAEAMAAANPKESWRSTWIAFCAYRAKQYAEVVRRLEGDGGATGLAILAMAHHRLGHNEEARACLDRATKTCSDWCRNVLGGKEARPLETWWATAEAVGLVGEAHVLIAGKPRSADPLERLFRAQAYLRFGERGPGDAELQATAAMQTDDPLVWLARSQILTKLGRTKEAAADRARGLQLAEQALVKRPDDGAAADALAGLLLEGAAKSWTILKPSAARSEGGATLTVQPDLSVLAGGTNSDTDVYIIEAEVQGRIGAIRLEVIPDPRMPAGGSGRAPTWGNFFLTDFRVTAGDSVVNWSRAYADFSQDIQFGQKKDYSIANAIDADDSTGWAVWPKVAEPHWAVFVPSQPMAETGKTRLTIRLACGSKLNKGYTLGRFRLSVADSDPNQRPEWFAAATTPHAKVGAAYLTLDDARKAADFLTKATEANPNPAPADLLVLALAHGRLKDADQVKKACAKATELLKPIGADAALLPLVREIAVTLGANQPAVQELIAAAAGEPPAKLNEAIEQNPDNAVVYRNRAEWFGQHARWKEASSDLAEEFRLAPTTHTGMKLAFLFIQLGDLDRYRAHCQTMLERWGSTEKNGDAGQTLKAILLVREFKADAQQLAHLAEVTLSGDPKADWHEWKMNAKGLFDYRSGRYDEALAICRASRERAPAAKGHTGALAALNLAIEAMALHRKGDVEEARRTLAQARSTLEQHVPGLDQGGWWHDLLAAHILYREADGLIATKTTEK